MASWIMHLAVSNEVSKHFELNLDRYNLGNLLPDASAHNRVAKDKSHFRIQKEPYEFSTASYYQYYDYNKFLKKYKTKMEDDLYLGYLSHLITDEIWIQKIYIKYMRDESRKKRVDQKENYYHDYDVLNELVVNRYKLKIEEIIEHMSLINTLDGIEEVEKSELPRLFSALIRHSKKSYKNEKLLLFNKCEVLQFIGEAANETVKIIKENELR